MKLQLLSDLHFEYHSDGGQAWIKGLNPSDVDILILAGDIAEVRGGILSQALHQFCDLYPEVIFVPGNHEYYGSSIAEADAVFDHLGKHGNLHVLRGDTVSIAGQRFVGATLWFTRRDDPNHAMWQLRLNDFHKIEGDFETWVYHQAAMDAQYLHEHIQDGDIVITHHIPSSRGVAPRWQSSIHDFGRFFVHQLPESLVKKAKVWCHGHGHDSILSREDGHLLIANPFGYLDHEVNDGFNQKLIIEI